LGLAPFSGSISHRTMFTHRYHTAVCKKVLLVIVYALLRLKKPCCMRERLSTSSCRTATLRVCVCLMCV